MKQSIINRRSFFQLFAAGCVAAKTMTMSQNALAADACPAGSADAKGPQEKALGYVTDAKKADKVKYKDKYKPNQVCGNCMFFKSSVKGAERKSAKTLAPCDPIFMKKCVNGAGWCGSWTPDPNNP